MAKIKILKTPPGYAPLHMREQWVGVDISLTDSPVPEEEISELIRNPNKGGYQTNRLDALYALAEVGKCEANYFWGKWVSGNFLFAKGVCALVI